MASTLPYKVTLNRDYYHKVGKIFVWCNVNFGSMFAQEGHTKRWHAEQVFGTHFFSFVHEEDAALFTLRWV